MFPDDGMNKLNALLFKQLLRGYQPSSRHLFTSIKDQVDFESPPPLNAMKNRVLNFGRRSVDVLSSLPLDVGHRQNPQKNINLVAAGDDDFGLLLWRRWRVELY